MTTTLLLFPNQLFKAHPPLDDHNIDRIALVEHPLFFGDPRYPMKMHKQKLHYLRACMKNHESALKNADHDVVYHNYHAEKAFTKDVIVGLVDQGTTEFIAYDPVDFILKKRLDSAAQEAEVEITYVDTPQFLNTAELNENYASDRKRFLMADFYKWQRKRLNILVDEEGKPEGGKWSYDEDNRKKVPKKLLDTVPFIPDRKVETVDDDARTYVMENWPDNPGSIDQLIYPTNHKEAASWLDRFLHDRFHLFGDYEDAIVEGENWLWHSVLTPMLNTGLLTPRQVVNETLKFAETNSVPLNALEGFLRQIIGWREFMRLTYGQLGTKMRTTNHWEHKRPLPHSFYDGTTGIDPIDDTIKRVLETGYCHHIERLMVLGGFMFLCEIDPDDIYKWFMEMFIDAYDWVMVPNVYAMSQNADGGLITTKPYFSGSAYVKKMSHYKHDDWADTWDGLYWRWIWHHREALGKNPRWAMMCRSAERMDTQKMDTHLRNADAYLEALDQQN